MSSTTGDQGDAARAALAGLLASTDIDIVAEATTRLPSGEEVRLVHAAARGEPNSNASVVVDSEGAVHPAQQYEALYGRDVFVPEVEVPAPPAPAPAQPVTINPQVNDLTLPECVTEEETVTVNLPPVPPQADVYLLADTTGSMGSILSTVKATVAAVVPAFAAQNVAWGVGNYKDFEDSPFAFQSQLSPTTNTAAVLTDVNNWSPASPVDGGDLPEAQLYALQQVATDPAIGWRPGSKRIVVWFGDAPGHDPICAAVSGTGSDITEATATTALTAPPGITVVAINLGDLDGDPTAASDGYGGQCPIGGTAGQATRISAATGGTVITGLDAATLITTLNSLISSAVPTIGHLVLQPTGAIAPFVAAVTPASYDALAGDVAHTLPFEVTWRGVQDCADTDQVFTGSLDVVADGTVIATKPVTITVPACRWHHSFEMVCGHQEEGDHGNDQCLTVVAGHYATAVTIYNPTTCPATIWKYFAPLALPGMPTVREPLAMQARLFARIELQPGQATLDDCCSLTEAVGRVPGHDPLELGVLDIVSDHPLDVTVTHTANGAGPAATSINSRTITPRRA